MKETKIYADEFCTTFASTTEMLEFLAERAKQSKWIRKPTRMLKLVPLEKEAETIEEACEKELEGIVEDTEKNTQLVLKVNKDFYPVRDCAIHTILKRAGINGTGLKKLEKATYAKVVNYCLQVANLKMRNSTMEYKVNQAYEELKRLIQWNPNSEEKFLQKMVCLLLPGQRKCWPEAIRDLRQSFEAEQWMIFVEKYRGKLEWLNSISLAELQRKIGEIFFVDHYKMIADQFLYKKDFETSLFLRIAMETGIRSADIPCIEWSCMHGKTIILEETKRGDLYKKLNGTFPKISAQSLRIMKLLYRKQGKIFTKSKEYYVRKLSCAWGIPGFHIHSFRNYRRKIERGISAGVQVPRIIPL